MRALINFVTFLVTPRFRSGVRIKSVIDLDPAIKACPGPDPGSRDDKLKGMLFVSVLLFLGLAPSANAETNIEVGPGVCDMLVKYIPMPGVAYQPGVDVNGDPVAPADVGNRQPMKAPTHFVIPIDDYLASRLTGNQAAAGTIQPTALLGVVTVDGDRLSFNGRPLGEDVDGDLATLCEKARQGNAQ